MTERERTIATLTFGAPDRIPFVPGNGRESTLRVWRTQGLPSEVTDYHAYVRKLLNMPPMNDSPFVPHNIDFRMRPQFEEKVIERKERSQIVQDWKGNICEISNEHDVRHLRGGIDFVTRRWIRCPVETREDFPDIQRRYCADDAARFPADWPNRVRDLGARKFASRLIIPGAFWQLRDWVGFEGLCVLMVDDPDFVMEMARVWRDFVAQMLERLLKDYVPDVVIISEDMAYKEKAMISPEMCRRFLRPCWRCWAEICRAGKVPVYGIDSDGFIGDLIPLWIDGGFILTEPVEVAAGNDLPEFRRRFGTTMAYRGGVDKRAMAKGGMAIRQEMGRLRPAIEAGGYIPGCDHGVPANVSWPNFVDYCRLLAQATGWL